MKLKPKKIIDIGCGIGENSIMLKRAGMNVVLADLDSVSLNFAEFRFKKHGLKYETWKIDKEEAPNEKFDVILLFDVVEHLPKEELKILVDKIIKMKHKDTKLMMTITFGNTEDYPEHFNADLEYKSLVEKLIKEHS